MGACVHEGIHCILASMPGVKQAAWFHEGGPEWTPYWINCDAWKATPYAKTTDDGTGVLTSEQRTTPGWSGANQIPLTVSGNKVTVDFQPI